MTTTEPEIERLGHFVVLGKLARGGMAEVMLGRQDGPATLAKPVAIKRILSQLASDAEFVRMFFVEARVAAQIHHPNVVAIYELGEDPRTQSYYLVMEYIDGCTLKRLVRQAHEGVDTLPLAIAVRTIADACLGLDHAHELKNQNGAPLQIVHRDISPENILVGFDGRGRVTDFGIARTNAATHHTRIGQLKGKISYMSPEQILGESVDRRTDVWALGVCLFWLASGQRPFSGSSEANTLSRIVRDPLPPLPAGVDPFLARTIARALEKQPDDRHPSARDLGAALEHWLTETGTTHEDVQRELERRFPAATDPERRRVSALLAAAPQRVTIVEMQAPEHVTVPEMQAPERITIPEMQAAQPATILEMSAPAAPPMPADPRTPIAPTAGADLRGASEEPRPETRSSPARPNLWAALLFAAMALTIAGLGAAILHLQAKSRTAPQEEIRGGSRAEPSAVPSVPAALAEPPEPSKPATQKPAASGSHRRRHAPTKIGDALIDPYGP